MNFESPAVRNGILGGMAGVILALLFYIFNTKMFFSIAGWLVIAVYIVFVVKAAREQKKISDAFPFREAFKTTLLSYAIMNLIYIVFHFILMNVVDPGLVEVQKEIALETLEKMSGILGEEGMEAAIDQIENQDMRFTLGKALSTFAIGLLFPGALITAIVAAVMKDTKKPEL